MAATLAVGSRWLIRCQRVVAVWTPRLALRLRYPTTAMPSLVQHGLIVAAIARWHRQGRCLGGGSMPTTSFLGIGGEGGADLRKGLGRKARFWLPPQICDQQEHGP